MHESTLDEARYWDRSGLQDRQKGMQTLSLPVYMTPKSKFPQEQVIDRQINRPENREILISENRFEPLRMERTIRGTEEEEVPQNRDSIRRPQRKQRKSNFKGRGPNLDTAPPPETYSGTEEEVSIQEETDHWVKEEERERQFIATVTAQNDGESGCFLPGCSVMVGEILTMMYLDSGCTHEGIIDRTLYNSLVSAGARFGAAPLTTRSWSASGHEILFERAVKAEVIIDTRSGRRQASLTFAIMEGDFSLGALIGAAGLSKLHMEIKCWDPEMRILPLENGCLPRAHILRTDALARTAYQSSIRPNSAAAVFVIGPIHKTAVGSDAVAEPGLGRWAGLTARTLTTIRQDRCKRPGAYVLVTNPSPTKTILIPRGSPIARLNILWRQVRAEQIAPGTEPAAPREKYIAPTPPRPVATVATFISKEEVHDTTQTEIEIEHEDQQGDQEELPDWLTSALETVASENKYDREELEKVARELVTSIGSAAEDLKSEGAHQLAILLLRHSETFGPIRFDKVQTSDKLEPMRIPLVDGAKEQRFPPRRLGYARRKMLMELTRDMLRDGVIQPSTSPWAFPVVIAPKADGSPRFCVDYRRLNDITRKDSYPLPRTDDLLDRLGEARFRSVLDLRTGYWQVPIAKEDREKTAFITPDSLFEFTVMPFGLCNAPAHFQRTMNRVLSGMNFFFTCVYLDDVIVFSKTFEEHLDHLNKVLSRLEQVGLKAKLTKCRFCQKEVKYLGHIVSNQGVRVDPDKTEVVRTARAPVNKKELRSFLGLLNYYRKFIKDYAAIAAPLSRLTGTKIPWEWGTGEQEAFEELKACLIRSPVLAFPHPTRPIKLRTDASGYSIAGVLQQQQEDESWHPIAFWSRSMRPGEKGYSATEREGLAAVEMVKHFRPYLEGRDFDLESDAQALSWIQNNDSHNARLSRWAIILKSKGVRLCYRPGGEMADADSLSRYPIASEDVRRPEEIDEDFDLYSEEVGKQLRTQSDTESEEHSILANILHSAVGQEEKVDPPVVLEEIRQAQDQDELVQKIIARIGKTMGSIEEDGPSRGRLSTHRGTTVP